MYCRITEIQFDHTKKDEIIDMLEGFRPSMMALPGVQSAYMIETGEGRITSFAVYDTQDNFNTASAEVGKIMGGFAAYFTAPPVGKEGPTVFHF